jgi:hypothetical protein
MINQLSNDLFYVEKSLIEISLNNNIFDLYSMNTEYITSIIREKTNIERKCNDNEELNLEIFDLESYVCDENFIKLSKDVIENFYNLLMKKISITQLLKLYNSNRDKYASNLTKVKGIVSKPTNFETFYKTF